MSFLFNKPRTASPTDGGTQGRGLPPPLEPHSQSQVSAPNKSAQVAGHRALLVADDVFAKVQGLQIHHRYYEVDGKRYEFGASVDMRLITTELLRLALNDPVMCNNAMGQVLEVLQRQLQHIPNATNIGNGNSKKK
jgi:hypothetical protein